MFRRSVVKGSKKTSNPVNISRLDNSWRNSLQRSSIGSGELKQFTADT